MAIALSGGHPQALTAESPEEPDRIATGEHGPGPVTPKKVFSIVTTPATAASPRLAADKIAWSERLVSTADDAAPACPGGDTPDARLIRESFAHVTESATDAMEHFYSCLFVQYPEMRSLFPHSMHDHMDRVFAVLEHIVGIIGTAGPLTECLGQLGRDHRKFGVRDRHYEAFFSVLIETVRHFCGHYWNDEIQAAWDTALDEVRSVMMAAARRDAQAQPPWWVGEVVRHDLRTPDLAVLTIKTDQRLSYRPGQYVPVQVPRWPRVWRNFSIANAPRDSRLIDLHVRAVPGGMVSGSLVHSISRGDTVLLGPPRGEMTPAAGCDRDILCIAGGTGLAPMKAIIEGALRARRPGSPMKIGLLYGARTENDLYDLAALQQLQADHRGFLVIPVVSDDPAYTGVRGTLTEVVAQSARCEGKDVFVSGPPPMVAATVAVLADRISDGSIHCDPPDAMR